MLIDHYLPADLPAIAKIYGHFVENTAITFDLEAPTENMMGEKVASLLSAGYPFLIARDDNGAVYGFAYASAYRPKKAYQHSAEVTIYLDPRAQGRGIGNALMDKLLESLETDQKFHLAIAVIADDAKASIGLHKKHGFKEIGYLAEVGKKFGKWHGTTLLSRSV